MKRWLLKRTKINVAEMAKELGIRQATATVLANRELYSRKEARDFLYGGEEAFGDPAEMKDLMKGVSLITQAIRDQKKIAVYGDYDVDGVMSTSILYQTILRCGGQAVFYVPHRQKEGYGLNLKAVEDLSTEQVEVLFTCDNGIAAIQEIALAKEKGMT
ncbi:MAG: single-stranded-DNA-specific exonuclease RecJ, partial [Anaerotignum sp.]|nr:single-stranded-DNA-specific exonuclease RecJ [Anaerotignum sp.]